MDTIEKIKTIINLIKPYIIADGGDLQFVDYLDGIVYISYAWHLCWLSDEKNYF